MFKILPILMLASVLGSASNTMDFNLNIEGEDDTLYIGVAVVSEGSGYRYISGNHYVGQSGITQKMEVQSQWDDRQGIKAEIISRQYTIRGAYYDDHVNSVIQRFKNGVNKEDFLRKEDLVRFLELGLSNDQLDLYILRDFNRYGTYTLGDSEPQAYTTSMLKVGLKMSGRAKPGSIGMLAEYQRFRTLRLLRIGQVQDDGNVRVLSTIGPFNKEVNGFVAGIFKAPDPSGRLYLTYTFQGTLGVSETPFDTQDAGLEGYYLSREKYDLLANLNISVIAGMNFKLGNLRMRASAEAFVRTSYAAPASQVLPIGVNEDNVPLGHDLQEYEDQFTEEYSDYEMVYGYSSQIKIIF